MQLCRHSRKDISLIWESILCRKLFKIEFEGGTKIEEDYICDRKCRKTAGNS